MNSIQLASVDKYLIFFYLATILIVGFSSSRHGRDNTNNFLLAGRRLSLPAFTATLVSTWYGGILGIGEFTYYYGLLNWVTQALPYYLFAVLFALFIAPKVRESRLYTIPDQFYRHYGKATGLIGSIFIFFLVSPASHLLMLSILFSAIFGIPFWMAVSVSIIFSTIYVFWGGFKSVVKTDIIQFVLMFSGFLILVVSLMTQYGGFSFLKQNLPAAHLQLKGGQSTQYVVVWFFIALWTFVDPGFYQRCYAARSPKVARRGILLSVGFWIIFDFLTTISGLYARAIFKNIPGLMAFPQLGATTLPPLLSGVFFIALLATIMSTLDSNSFLAAVTFGRDIVWRFRKNTDINRATQLGLIVSILFSVLLLTLVPSVVKIWYLIGTLFIPSLLLPLISIFIPFLKLSRLYTLISMIITFIVTAGWLIIGFTQSNLTDLKFPGNIQPFFIGLGFSVIFYGSGLFKNILYQKHKNTTD
ncbi:MAG: sodium:solute symporter family protein [Candidatus Marinimicrobia bacterium]|nr:sodium:solute symporter family protein [Candidatus Neomarinimicrobiota bacterium]